VTADATLDLSHTEVSNFAVLSTNAIGTTFTVKDVATAFAIAGGPGQDTIVADGFAFTADQRNAIFATASIEKIIDTSGTYTAGPLNPNVVQLTTGNDTVASSSPNLVVNATAATLNNGDQLSVGGSGTLALYGSGTFRVDQLATFSGFSTITLNNYTNGTASLYLGSQPITVTGLGSGSEYVYLGGGQTTYNGGSGSNIIWSLSNSNWNSADVINGGNYGQLYLNWSNQANVTYDLTANTFQNINYVYGYGDNLTLKIEVVSEI
jgi:hypothetical protein